MVKIQCENIYSKNVISKFKINIYGLTHVKLTKIKLNYRLIIISQDILLNSMSKF
jgi:hypothetical protein